MPCCTYLYSDEFTAPTSDSEINSLLTEVRTLTGEDWRISEYVYEIRRWFRSSLVRKSYGLYSHVSGPEFQIINFYRPERDGEMLASINHNNSAGHVAAFLYGLLAGVQHSHSPKGERP